MEYVLTVENNSKKGYKIKEDILPFERAKGLMGKLGLIHPSLSGYYDITDIYRDKTDLNEVILDIQKEVKSIKPSYLFMEGFSPKDEKKILDSIKEENISTFDNSNILFFYLQGILNGFGELWKMGSEDVDRQFREYDRQHKEIKKDVSVIGNPFKRHREYQKLMGELNRRLDLDLL